MRTFFVSSGKETMKELNMIVFFNVFGKMKILNGLEIKLMLVK